MSTPCAVCLHPSRLEVDAALVRGESGASLGRKYGLHERAISRHRTAHLPEALRNGHQASRDEAGRTIRRDLEEIVASLKERARAAGEHLGDKDRRGWLDIADRLLKALELLGKATGEIATGANVTVQLNQVFAEIGVADKAEAMRLIGVARGLEGQDAESAKEAILAAAMEIGRAEPARLIPLLKLVPWAVEIEPGE